MNLPGGKDLESRDDKPLSAAWVMARSDVYVLAPPRFLELSRFGNS